MNPIEILMPENFFILLPSLLFFSFFIYLYYFQNRHTILLFWTYSWLAHFLRLLFLAVPLFSQIPWTIYQSLAIGGTLLQLCAAHRFIGKETSKYWYFLSIFTLLLSYIVSLFHDGMPYRIAVLCGFLCIAYSEIIICFTRYIYRLSSRKNVFGFFGLSAFLFFLSIPILLQLEVYLFSIYLDTLLRIFVLIGFFSATLVKNTYHLSAQRDFYHQLTAQVSDIICKFSFSPVPHITYISPNITTLTGYTPQDFYTDQNLFYSVIHSHDRNIFEDAKRALKSSIDNPDALPAPSFQTFRLIHKNKQITWIEQSLAPYYDEESHSYGFFAVMRNISEKIHSELKVRQQNERLLIGRMAANLADEIRNPLTSLRGFLQYFSTKTEFKKYAGTFQILMEELDQSSAKINQYVLFGKPKSSLQRPCDLNSLLQNLLPNIQRNAAAISDNLSVELNLTPTPKVFLDKKDMENLLYQLTTNAFESMPNGGTVYISTQSALSSIILTIQDEGTGIPPTILENIGQPFLSTKKTKIGLGLPTCYTIAERNQGKIDIVSTAAGTRVSIQFPLSNNAC